MRSAILYTDRSCILSKYIYNYMCGYTDRAMDMWKCIVSDDTGTTVKLQWLEHCWLIYNGCFKLILETLRKFSYLQIYDNLG